MGDELLFFFIFTSMKRCFHIILLLALSSTTRGQGDIRFKQITEGPGEDIVGVQSFYKDSFGYVWMGSASFDLLRFDGVNKRRYSSLDFQNDQFKTTRGLFVFEDRTKRLWAGTDVGALFVYDRQHDQFILVNDSLTSIKSRLYCQAEAPDGSFWLGSMGSGLFRYHPDTKAFKQYAAEKNNVRAIPDNYITGMVYDSSGLLWIGTTRGLCSYDSKTDQFTNYPLTNANPSDTYRYRVIRNIHLSENKLYLSTYGGLQIFNLTTKKSTHLIHNPENENSLSHNSLFDAVGNPDGTLWIATYGGGLNLYNPLTEKFSSWKKDNSNESISSNNLFTLLLDRDGLLWIGADDNVPCVYDTKAKKINVLKNRASRPEGISSGWVRSIYQENDSVFWLGFNGSGLNKLNLNTGKTEKFVNDPKNPKSLGHNSVMSISKDAAGKIWVGLEGAGLNQLNTATGTFTRYESGKKNSISNNAISAMLIDNENKIWTTSFRSGLTIYDIDRQQFKNINDDSLQKATGTSLAFVEDMFELNGNIWFNAQNQVVLFDRINNRFVKVASVGQAVPVSNPTLLEIRPYSKDEILLITKDEIKTIHYVNPDSIQLSSVLKMEPGDDLKSFVVDGSTIWYVTKNNLVRWNLEKDEKRIYSESDGILADELTTIYRDNQGRIFVLTLDGLNWFYPNQIVDDTVSRKIIFTDFKLFNHSVNQVPDKIYNFSIPETISQLKTISLNREHSFFSFEFAAIEFMAPEKIQYSYKLEGFDKDWVNVGNRNFASYTNLDPGEYTFRVKASNPDGFWGNSSASISITINPPFWQTWWFIAITILTLGSGVYAAHRYRLSQSLKVERLRTKIASDLHDEVGSSLTKISIFSDLVQTDVDEKEKRNYLLSIGNLSREIVNTMSDIVWAIDNKNDTIGALLIRMKDFATEVLQAKNIELTFSVLHLDENKILEPALKQNLYLIFKESINNIVKHAQATRVTVRISNQNQFTLQVEDNGNGFSETSTTHGNGLRNMQRRAKAIEGDFTIHVANGTTLKLQRTPI